MGNVKSPLQNYLDQCGECPYEFSRRAAVPSSTVDRIVKGLNRPYRKTALKIIRASKGKLTLKDFGYE